MKRKNSLEEWLEEIEDGTIKGADARRSIAYAEDLDEGLQMLRTFPQGVAVFGSARLPKNNEYYAKAQELGAKLAQNGHTVITGGGPSIMEAVNRGAHDYGGRSVGLNIELDHEQEPNAYVTDTMTFKYFFARKVMLAMSAKVYVFFPGGFGTMDEFSELLELVHEHKMPKMPLFLFGREFWEPLDAFFKGNMTEYRLIEKDATKLYKITDDIDEIVAAANKSGHLKIDENLYDAFKH